MHKDQELKEPYNNVQSVKQNKKNKKSRKDGIFKDNQQLDPNNVQKSKNDELVTIIQAICNIKDIKIQIYSKSDITYNTIYKPDSGEGKGLLHLVRDD